MAITINNVRFSYCNLLQAVTKPGQTEAKFSVTVLVPKTNTAAKAAIDAAVQQAIEQGVSKCWNGVRPPLIAICVYDGDGQRPSDGMPFGEECKGMWVFTASSKAANPPEVVDANVQRIINPAEVYSGMWGNINVNFFPYANGGKKGIGCGLNCVQKTRDDEPLAGHVSAQEAFSAVQPQQAYAAPAAPQQPYTAPTGARVSAAACSALRRAGSSPHISSPLRSRPTAIRRSTRSRGSQCSRAAISRTVCRSWGCKAWTGCTICLSTLRHIPT